MPSRFLPLKKLLALAGAMLLPVFGVCLCALNSGCHQMAAAQAAQSSVQAAQTTADAASSAAQTTAQAAQSVLQGAEQIAAAAVPSSVLAQLNSIIGGNNLTSWGQPLAIYTADQTYVFVYKPGTQLLGPSRSRVVVVDALGRTARLQRLQEQGQ